MSKYGFLQRIGKMHFSEEDVSRILKALQFLEDVHTSCAPQSRLCVSHPIEVAYLLALCDAPAFLIIAGLLHNTMNPNHTTPSYPGEIGNLFGENIEQLVRGSNDFFFSRKNQFFRTSSQNSDVLLASTSYVFMEPLQIFSQASLLFLLRVVNHLANFKNIAKLPKGEQKKFALEALNILAPISTRLGLAFVQRKLEDKAFKILSPTEYDSVKDKYPNKTVNDSSSPIRSLIKTKMQQNGINAKVTLAPQSKYSLYQNWLENGENTDSYSPHEAVFPYLILVNTPSECYQALGILHSFAHPISGNFYDYIASPKTDFHRALHTKVKTPLNVEIQVIIQDKAMWKESEKGVVSLWQNKSPKTTAFHHGNVLQTADKYIQIITPIGETKLLPQDATPVDFAFSIHKEIGMQCVSAIVNGKNYPMEAPLQPLYSVQILTNSSSIGPKSSWLNTVQTKLARAEIQKFYQIQEANELVDNGREILNEKLSTQNIKLSYKELRHRINIICTNKKISISDLFTDIALNREDVNEVYELITYYDMAMLANEGFRRASINIIINASNRTGLAADITQAVASLGINLEAINAYRTGTSIARIKITVSDITQRELKSLVDRIQSINSVNSIHFSNRQLSPFHELQPYTTKPARGQHFKGRGEEINQILKILEIPGSFLLIWGARRIGKTSLLGELTELLDHAKFIPILIDLQDTKLLSTLDFMHQIIEQLTLIVPSLTMPKWSTIKKNPLYTFDSIVKRALPDFKTLVIVIDEFQLFNNLKERRESAFLSKKDLALYFRHQLQHKDRFSLVVTGGSILKEVSKDEAVSALLELSHFMELNYLSRKAAEEIITEPSIEYERKVVSQILDLTSGTSFQSNHPGYVQLVCSRLTENTENVINLASFEHWLNNDLPNLPEQYFSNLWGYSLGINDQDQSHCLATLLTIALLSNENTWVAEQKILTSELSLYISDMEIIKALHQLKTIHSIVAHGQMQNTYAIKTPIAKEWLLKNYSIKELLLDGHLTLSKNN